MSEEGTVRTSEVVVASKGGVASEGERGGVVPTDTMSIDEHLRSMPTPPWLDPQTALFRQPQDLNMLAMSSPHSKLFQAPPTCHQQPVIVSRCDVAVPSSSDTSSSSCSPSSSENALQSTIKPDSSVDASVAAILNEAMKPEPPSDSNEYMHAMQQRNAAMQSHDLMALHIGYGLRCSSSTDSGTPLTSSLMTSSSATGTGPAAVRRSRSSQDGMLKCQFCPKKWADQASLQIHMQDCRLIRCHECASCGKRFKARGGLQQHMRIHNNDRPYACHYCAKRFTQKSHVDQHERIHTGAKPFTCQFCGRAFRQRSQQMGHEATHANGGGANLSNGGGANLSNGANLGQNNAEGSRPNMEAARSVSSSQSQDSATPPAIQDNNHVNNLVNNVVNNNVNNVNNVNNNNTSLHQSINNTINNELNQLANSLQSAEVLFPLHMTSMSSSSAVNSLLALSQNSNAANFNQPGQLPGHHQQVNQEQHHHNQQQQQAMQQFHSQNMHQALLNQML